MPTEDAATRAVGPVGADLRGVHPHGLCRLTIYLELVRAGLINPKPSRNPRRVTPVAASLDGENGFGFVIGTRAMQEAIAMAREFGIGVVSARRSTHFGMAASYAIPAVEAGLMAMVFSNASQAMPPWGSKQMLLGTNPFCMAAPAGKHRPIILDMSPAVAARGHVVVVQLDQPVHRGPERREHRHLRKPAGQRGRAVQQPVVPGLRVSLLVREDGIQLPPLQPAQRGRGDHELGRRAGEPPGVGPLALQHHQLSARRLLPGQQRCPVEEFGPGPPTSRPRPYDFADQHRPAPQPGTGEDHRGHRRPGADGP